MTVHIHDSSFGDSREKFGLRLVYLFWPSLGFLENNKELKKAKSRLVTNGEINGVNRIFEKVFSSLIKISSRNIQKIGIEVISRDGIDDLMGSLQNEERLDVLRVIGLFDDKLAKTTNIDRIFLDKRGVSHLVDFSACSDVDLCKPSDIGTDLRISGPYYNIEDLVVDVCLDICMFYSFDFLKSCDHADGCFRHIVSSKKIEFLKNTNLLSTERGVNYYSFATICRENGKHDLERYEQLWVMFVEWLKKGKELGEVINKTKDITLYEDSVDKVMQNIKMHKSYGQLPLKKIQRIVKSLDDGEYLLLRIDGKPKKKQERQRILNIFGGEWRLGKVLILPISEYRRVSRFYPNVSIFKFIKTDYDG